MIPIMIACTLGGISLGFAIGGIVERFIFNPKEEFDMSTESDALKASLDAGASAADNLASIISSLHAKAIAVNAQMADGAAIVLERDALKAQVADLNTTIATLQAEADATNAKNKANADALSGVAGSLPA